MEQERRQNTAELMRHLDLKGQIDHWNRLLREIDPDLQLVKAMESTTFPGLKPGYFHVLRTPKDAPPTLIAYETEDGEFLEPDSGLLERLRKGDMWSDRVQAAARERDRKLQRAAEREREREREERVDEVMDRLWHKQNLSVRIPRRV